MADMKSAGISIQKVGISKRLWTKTNLKDEM